MSFHDPWLDGVWSLVLLVCLLVTAILWLTRRVLNHWAFASLSLALLAAFPAATKVSLPPSWADISPLMATIGAAAGSLSMILGATAWGLSVVALLVRYNWRPTRELRGVVPAYLGGFLGFCITSYGLWQLLHR